MKASSNVVLRSILFLALVWGVTSCGTSETTAPPKIVDEGGQFEPLKVGTDSTLEVVSWNIQTFAREASTTVDLVQQVVRDLDADIYALQEMNSEFYFNQIEAGLDGWTAVRSSEDSYNLAYIFRNDGQIADVSLTEILTGDTRPFPRSPYVLEFTYRGEPMAVINNHLKCCGNSIIDDNDPWDETTRRRDACLLMEEWVNVNMPDRGVMIVGDFNDELDDPLEGNVFANFLADTSRWRFVDMEIALGDPSGWSYPSWPSHLDHILITDQLFPATAKSAAMVDVVPLQSMMDGGMTEYRSDLSDHLPVVLRIDLD